MPCRSKISLEEIFKQLFDRVGSLCCWYLFPLEAYCRTIAAVGLIMTSLDIYRVLSDGPKLSDSVFPMRREEGSSQQPISEEAERDIRLVTCVIECTVYLCLLIGSYYGTPLFLLPWLVIRLFILVSSVVLFFKKLVLQKPMKVSALSLTGGLLEVHNLLYVSCLLNSLTAGQLVKNWF